VVVVDSSGTEGAETAVAAAATATAPSAAVAGAGAAAADTGAHGTAAVAP
jgi:hypothetical protein